jgi:hypothetical protein
MDYSVVDLVTTSAAGTATQLTNAFLINLLPINSDIEEKGIVH